MQPTPPDHIYVKHSVISLSGSNICCVAGAFAADVADVIVVAVHAASTLHLNIALPMLLSVSILCQSEIYLNMVLSTIH